MKVQDSVWFLGGSVFRDKLEVRKALGLVFSGLSLTQHLKTRFDQGENVTYTEFLAFAGRSNETFNLTTGVFKVPSSSGLGIYEFTFYGFCDGSTEIEVYKNTFPELIFKNNNQKKNGNSNAQKRSDDSSLGKTWHMKLKQGNIIYLKVGQGFVAKYHDYTFSVNLIRNIDLK